MNSSISSHKLLRYSFTVTWVDKCSMGFAFWRLWVTALPILHVSSLVGWLPPLPSISYFSSEKQLPPITGPNSIRQGLVLKGLVSISSWCTDSGLCLKILVRVLWCHHLGSHFSAAWYSVVFTLPLSLLPPTSSIAQSECNCAMSWFTVLVIYSEATWFLQMPGNPNAPPGHAFGVEFTLQGPLFFFTNHNLKLKKEKNGLENL